MTCVDLFNHRRIHGRITDDATDATPAEIEAIHYLQQQPVAAAVTLSPEQSSKAGRFNLPRTSRRSLESRTSLNQID